MIFNYIPANNHSLGFVSGKKKDDSYAKTRFNFARVDFSMQKTIMSESLGTKIKRLREAAGLKWGDLAEATDLETAQIVLIESGEVSPPISVLIKLARRLGVRLGTLLDGTETTSPIITTYGGRQSTLNSSRSDNKFHIDYYSLAEGKADRYMEPFIVKIVWADSDDPRSYSEHEGEEFLYVLEGELVVYYGRENKERFVLKKGDTIYYDALVPHCLTAPEQGQMAKVLAVMYSPQ